MRIRFQPRPVPFVVTLALIILGVALAQWQTRRAAEKDAIAAQLSARAAAPTLQLGAQMPLPIGQLEYRRVTARGHFDVNAPFYLDNRPQDGQPGFYVLMPFQIGAGPVRVLVERGWLPVNRRQRDQMLPYRTPQGEIEIAGVVRRNPGRVMQLGTAPLYRAGAIVQNLDVAGVAAAMNWQLHPLVLEQVTTPSIAQDGLIRDWPQPSGGAERHRGYAFQWYALALMALVFFVVTGCRREHSES